MIGVDEYVDASKDTWRGWKWNRIADAAVRWAKLPPTEKARRLSHKTVLYLVGPDDKDRAKALSKGFASHNLVAIDLVQGRVDEVRRSGGLAICGSLQQVIANWPKDWPIDVVDADFCSGWVSDVSCLKNILLGSPAMVPDTVFSINLMRGRDSNCNNLRQFLDIKHRGELWGKLHLLHASILQSGESETPLQRTRPEWTQYRSKTSGQWFDSVVHRWGVGRPEIKQKTREVNAAYKEYDRIASVLRSDAVDRLSRVASRDDNIRGIIAAIRAVRTKKLRSF